MFRVSNIVVVCFLAMTLVAKADIRIIDNNSAEITGTITELDAKHFQEFSSKFDAGGAPLIWLNSKGGDVSAAIKIGRLVRKHDGQTIITQLGKCYSSCALIFIAGVSRTNFGELGLHRPYLASAPQSREAVEKQVPLMLSMVKSYVAEMGITDNFYQQMVNTEPSQMMIYRWDDYATLVPQQDPVYAEIEIARDARRYGITTSEMRQREKDTKSCDRFVGSNISTSDTSRWNTCTEAIRWGLSERVYLERQAKLDGACLISDDERETLKKTPPKLQSEHPFVRRFVACQRDVMLGRQHDDWEDVPGR